MKIIHAAVMFAFVTALIAGHETAFADEGGISFWLPGQYGSFAAVPGSPGLSFLELYYHTSPNAGAGQEFRAAGESISVCAAVQTSSYTARPGDSMNSSSEGTRR
jgi:hypothetical protein